jgi:VIT1/CCC1 family predicted Fe2+/Mn2+ transporter
MLPFVMAVDGLPIYLIVRFGLLPSMVALFTTSILLSLPAGPTLDHWSANAMLIGLAVSAAILGYGYARSQGAHSRRLADG